MELIGYIILAIVVIVFFAFNSIRYKRQKEWYLQEKIKAAYGKKNDREYKFGEFEKIRHFFEYKKNKDDLDFYIDDITWNDVDMDKVFKDMNNTQSSVGEEYLYMLLRMGKQSEEDLKEFDSLVNYFINAGEDKRVKIEKVFAGIGHTRSISIFDFIHRLNDLGKRSNTAHYCMLFALIASFVVLLIEPPIGVVLFITCVCINVVNYYRKKSEVENYFICFNYLVGIIIKSKELSKLSVAEFDKYNARISELTKDLKDIEKGVFLLPSNSVKESIAEMVMEYVRMLFHVDLIKFNAMLTKTIDKIDLVDELFEMMGRIESAYAVASYREMLNSEYGYYAVPEFVENKGFKMIIEEGYHPLIDEPVPNSINTDRPVLLTGSNASGKSTFLKMIALNAILCQTIYTGVCKRYVGKMYSVYSSMSLRDNLDENESYYIVEIKSLKRIVDMIKSGEDILCFVDEVLRGTNTVERISASSELLKYLYDNNVMSFAATHDIELTHILEKYYGNYHFEEIIENDDVKFNYRIMDGRATTRNAIKLLGIIGFEKNIIDAATSRSEVFLETGNWI